MYLLLWFGLLLPAQSPPPNPSSVLVECESLDDLGGWFLDTQFTFEMGSSYLLAHGLGHPVADARGKVQLPRAGAWRVWVRTKDWVARWQAPGAPGRFAVEINGQRLAQEFGNRRATWGWRDGGVIELDAPEAEIALVDLTGYEGRCDALLFTTPDAPAPPDRADRNWRDQLLDNGPEFLHDGYDLVVVGGGYAGIGAALSAARMGAKVALIQDRPVLGGNGSSEVRVWSKGEIRRGRFPRIGEIVEEFADQASASPGRADEFGDAHKEAVVRAEAHLDLYLMHRAEAVQTEQSSITAIHTVALRSGQRHVFRGRNYCDATGHGWISAMAGADGEVTATGRMGMSNMWRWENAPDPQPLAPLPWALDLEMEDFPYPHRFHGEWFWESGFDKDPLADAEGIRDWNLRAVYGAFQAMKLRGGSADHRNARLTWIAPIGGPRESRRLFGDVILTQEDIVNKRVFEDGCVPSTWTIDLHYPKKQFAGRYPDNPFISIAVHDRRVDRDYGYPIPYRCLYSRNIDNLFMAGRCISVTHEALGTVRVMRTCGMMGEVVGKAAALCAAEGLLPGEVFPNHWQQLAALLELPAVARRADLHAPLELPEVVPVAATAFGPMLGRDPAMLDGQVVDDRYAECLGSWTTGSGLPGFIGWGYRYATGGSGARAVFRFQAERSGVQQLQLAYMPHENRGARVPIHGRLGGKEFHTTLDMRHDPGPDGFAILGEAALQAGEVVVLEIDTQDVDGFVSIDACRLQWLR